MDLVNLMYRYINKFLNSKDLIKELKSIDLKKYSSEEIVTINKMIEDVENIILTIPNEIDEIEKKRIDFRNELIDNFETSLNEDNLSDNDKKIIQKQYEKFLKEKEEVRDGCKLYNAIFVLMTKNSLVNHYANKMNAKELLDFITKYIYVPLPPEITQEEFNDLVKVGIEEDARESIWRLAFNYNNKNKDFYLIEDYFIEKRDSYYLIELVCAVKEDLDLNRLVTKILNTKDDKFIQDLIEKNKKINILSEDEIKRIKEEIN